MNQSEELTKFNLFGNVIIRGDIHHLNDIEPINSSEILISIRDMNLLMRYNYKTDRLVSYDIGLGQKQHDADLVNDKVFIFSNNHPFGHTKYHYNTINYKHIDSFGFNNEKGVFQLDWFQKKKLTTGHQGQQQVLNDSTFMVEETNPGIIYIVEGKKERKYFFKHPNSSKHISMIGWSRFERFQ